jgi:hypothetical protein
MKVDARTDHRRSTSRHPEARHAEKGQASFCRHRQQRRVQPETRGQQVPISNDTARLDPGETCIDLNGGQREATGDQHTAVSQPLLLERLGTLTDAGTTGIGRAILVRLPLAG